MSMVGKNMSHWSTEAVLEFLIKRADLSEFSRSTDVLYFPASEIFLRHFGQQRYRYMSAALAGDKYGPCFYGRFRFEYQRTDL